MPLVVALAFSASLACNSGGGALDFGAAKGAAPTTTKKEAAAPKKLLPTRATSGIGTNLVELREYSTERPFNDVFKQSRAWISTSGTTWDDAKPLVVDARGWVKQLGPEQKARALVFWGDGLQFPKGSYAVSWTGTGTLDFWPQGGTVSSTGKGEHALDADPAKGGLAVTITKTDPADPIRDIRVLLPGADPTKRFNSAFLDRLKGYGTLRFMDWMETNRSTIIKPEQRAIPADARYTEKGVPVEVIADLCNSAGTDAWVNIGHTWSNELVEATAVVLRDQLKPDLRVYVEHSNEIWNGIFPQADFVRKRGIASELSKDVFEAQIRWHAKRSAEIHAIFDKVFGAQSNRVVRVLGGWAANAWSTKTMLDYLKDNNAAVDVVAIAPYFGNSLGEPEQRGEVQGYGLPELMKRLEKSVDESLVWVADQKKWADKFGVGLVAYEGGQHLVGVGPVADDAHVNGLFDAANTAPAMKGLYLRYLRGWKDQGGGLFLHFTSTMRPSKYGRWGAAETMEQPRAQAPKLDALLTFAETTPRWWQ